MISILLVIAMMASLATMTSARASKYLDDYSALNVADGGGKVSCDVIVNGVKTMSKIGVQSLEIQEKTSINGRWHTYEVRYGVDDPSEFYWTNNYTYCNTFEYTGTIGYYYRVIVTAYAGNSTGSDTGTVTSAEVRCV